MGGIYMNKIIINLLLNIKKTVNNITTDNFLFFYNKELFTNCMYDIIILLKNTLNEIDNIYYKYYLLPKLEYNLSNLSKINIE